MKSVENSFQKIVRYIRERKYEMIFCLPKHIAINHIYRHYGAKISKKENVRLIRSNPTVWDWAEKNYDNENIMQGVVRKQRILFYNTDDRYKDIKYFWEKNRNHDLVWIVKERREGADSNQLIEEKISRQIPCNTNAMEVAISLINVIEACKLDKEGYELSKDTKEFIKNSLIYICVHEERAVVYSTNHYFFDLIGALWTTNHCPEICDMVFSVFLYNELISLLKVIVSNDGSLYEESTFYHRYVLEALLEFVFFNSYTEDERLKAYIDSMMEFAQCIADNDRIFGFGDNDSGRVLAIPSYQCYSSRSIVLINSIYRKAYGIEYTNIKDQVCYKKDFGIIVFRSFYYSFAMRCDEGMNKRKAKYIGGHAHNDLLSMEINFFHIPVIINRGTYLYIEEGNCRYNNLMTKNNSGFFWEEEEQNPISNDWKHQKKINYCNLILLSKNKIEASFNYESGHVHRRIVMMNDNELIINDVICGSHNNGRIRYYLSEEASVGLKDGNVEIIVGGHVLSFVTNGAFSIRECTIYPEYGQRVNSTMIEIEVNIENISSVFKIIH